MKRSCTSLATKGMAIGLTVNGDDFAFGQRNDRLHPACEALLKLFWLE
jgi:hypothetical protein